MRPNYNIQVSANFILQVVFFKIELDLKFISEQCIRVM